MTAQNNLLEAMNLDVIYGHGASAFRALEGVSLTVESNRRVGIVGESGSGKSTLAKALVGMIDIAGGEIRIDGTLVSGRRRSLAMLRRVQMIPQDPYASLNPRRTVGQSLREAIDPRSGRARGSDDRIVEILRAVSLDEDIIHRYPHEFSGGQRQRIAIARALLVRPEIIIADEITSALDVSAQADVLRLIGEIKQSFGLTLIFISHNMAVIQEVSDDVVVMRNGVVVEVGSAARIFYEPQQEYTKELLRSVPGARIKS